MIGSVIQSPNGYIYVLDERGRELSRTYVGNGVTLMGYTGTTFSIKSPNGYVYVLNESCRELSRTYVGR